MSLKPEDIVDVHAWHAMLDSQGVHRAKAFPANATIHSTVSVAWFMEDQLTDTQCLTPAEMAGLRRAFERYGTGDGFWLNYKAILDEVSHRDGCDWKVVNKEMQAAFREWSKEDPHFL